MGLIREEWRDIVGFEGAYMISNIGRVFSSARVIVKRNGVEMTVSERFIRPRRNRNGYLLVTLSKNGMPANRLVHQLVARAFIGRRPRGMEVAHGDGNQLNNCDWNLRYDTPKGNGADRIRHGRMPRGERHPRAKLSDADVLLIRSSTDSCSQLARDLGVSDGLIRMVRKGIIWKHVGVGK